MANTRITQAITAMALDPGGARLLTGSNDYTVRFWDFAGMDASHRSFRDVEPHSGHQVRSLCYSISGDQFLVTTGNAKPKIFSRDGHELYGMLNPHFSFSHANSILAMDD